LEPETNFDMQIKRLIAFGVCTLVAATAFSQKASEELMQKKQMFKRKITRTMTANYLLYTPPGYQAKGEKKWPLILFLHGAGERGTNLAKVAIHGPPKLVKQGKEFPFIIVSPQCPEGEAWTNDVLTNLLDHVIAKYAVDTNRIYLTGLSMGGFGTWALGIAQPQRFAAIAPICGGGEKIRILLADGKRKEALKNLPVWAFHGAEDPTVLLEESERMVATLKKIGCREVKLTVYPKAQHDSWTETYNDPELYDWFRQHDLKANAEKGKAASAPEKRTAERK
jgi:predicted peptidase